MDLFCLMIFASCVALMWQIVLHNMQSGKHVPATRVRALTKIRPHHCYRSTLIYAMWHIDVKCQSDIELWDKGAAGSNVCRLGLGRRSSILATLRNDG